MSWRNKPWERLVGKLFMKKKNRDTVWKKIPKSERYKHRRRSVRNQLLHPMYVVDYPRKLTSAEKGFDNILYKTHFSALYEIVELRR